MRDREAQFSRTFWITAGVHVLLILSFFGYSFIQRWRNKRPPREVMTFVALQPAAEASAPEAVAALQPAPPPPPPPPPAPRPQIQRSTERVRRDPPPAQPPPRPALTPEQIRQQLAQSLPQGATPTAGTTDAFTRYMTLLYETLYRSWVQPTSVMPGTTATALIRVERDGRISRRELTRRSGQPAMDESVQRALNALTRLQPLPAEIRGTHYDFTIEFELTGAL